MTIEPIPGIPGGWRIRGAYDGLQVVRWGNALAMISRDPTTWFLTAAGPHMGESTKCDRDAK